MTIARHGRAVTFGEVFSAYVWASHRAPHRRSYDADTRHARLCAASRNRAAGWLLLQTQCRCGAQFGVVRKILATRILNASAANALGQFDRKLGHFTWRYCPVSTLGGFRSGLI